MQYIHDIGTGSFHDALACVIISSWGMMREFPQIGGTSYGPKMMGFLIMRTPKWDPHLIDARTSVYIVVAR